MPDKPSQPPRPLRVRFLLRIEVPGILAGRVERALIETCKRLPGAKLSRTDHADHGGGTLRKLRRRDITPKD